MKNTKKTVAYFVFLFVIMILNHAATAQTITVNPRRETQILKDAQKAKKIEQTDIKYPQQFIKIRPFGIITGKLPVYFENMQSSRFGYEVGAGITTKNFLFQSAYDDLRDHSDNIFSGVYAGFIDQNNYQAWEGRDNRFGGPGGTLTRTRAPIAYTLGFMASGALKYYYKTNPKNTQYISILTDYRNHNAILPRYVSKNRTSNTDDFDSRKFILQKINTTNISLNIGNRTQYKAFIIDFYAGAGFRYVIKKMPMFASSYVSPGVYAPMNGYQYYTTKMPVFTSGLSIGIPKANFMKMIRNHK